MADEAKSGAGEGKGATERATNCAACNKRLQRKKQYYRNGGYFCNKRCWKQAADKAAKAEQDAKGKESKEQAAAS